MFGVDFTELLVIMVVALIVIGPERLPKVARTMGMMWARAQRYVNGVKADIERDMAAEELRQLKQQVQEEAERAQRSAKEATQALDLKTIELHNALIDAEAPVKAAAEQAVLPTQKESVPPTERDK